MKPLYALSLHQPWASLVVAGAKRIETRSWPTRQRGRLMIHAARAAPAVYRELCQQEPFARVLAQLGRTYDTLPRGVLLGQVEVLDCVPIDDRLIKSLSDREYAFGDYTIGRWAWKLGEPVALEQPVPAAGRQGLFNVAGYGQWA